ncbi:Cobalamin biosynthesis protein CbiB [Pseudovibrio axinellae]|uniref:Cobalamin biosynthesis protein CobD n=1 Tax=Pseudovibrio axinellae TaxID=989403 RepID=A0A166B177_9HYPH|nr:adenosylcobinamide-phosphate synthase CbiB [Pseudovibrio axinellae]KZL21807.1 Cobalamin biosynthesis protein CbiB [Pseudovibrio axinellae]SEQ79296.1 adenosylcobinamide-phosphate synthase [Pseudovibrio axinellae]
MLVFENTLWIVVLAVLLDAVIGDPDWLWSKLPHPVTLIGKAISCMDNAFNKAAYSRRVRKINGVLTLVLLVGTAALSGAILQLLLEYVPLGELLIALIGMVLIAQKSLYQHVARVRDALKNSGLQEARRQVSMIVGRNPEYLDEAGVSRAAIESCSENFSDGVVAPIFWFAALGLPGLFIYKAVNTADSMIGHKNATYEDFGWASARFDDLINLPASRLSGLLIVLAAYISRCSYKAALATIHKEAHTHRSPNAGWPEAAMAGALGIALAGPRQYDGYRVEDPFMNATGRETANADDIDSALKLMAISCVVLAVFLTAAALL